MDQKEKLWLIWKEPVKRRRYIIGELSCDASLKYMFRYLPLELEDALKDGFDYFPGFEDLEKVYESFSLFPNIETRLPNPNRPDYLDILNDYGLTIHSSKMEILKKTTGRLLTDLFEFVPVFDSSKVEFAIAGTRYYLPSVEFSDSLKVNHRLSLQREKDNSSDSYAVLVFYEVDGKNYKLGYVPRYYSREICSLLDKGISYSAKIQNINLDTPLNDDEVTITVRLIFGSTGEDHPSF